MLRIDSETIRTPFSSASDYHLILFQRGAETESYRFIPESDEPGLTIDLLCIDLLPRRAPRVQDMFEALLSRYRSSVGPERARHVIILRSPTDIVFHLSAVGHPLVGDQHTIGRLIDRGKSI